VTIAAPGGAVVATLQGPARRGLNRLQWGLGGGGRGGGRGGAGGGPAGVGDYVATLEVGAEKISKPARIRERIR
jgi:hypothetical protein